MNEARLFFALMAVAATAPGARGQSKWSVDQRPFLDIPATTANGNVVLETIAGATRLSNGTVVVADERASKVRFFDPAGKLVRSVGQPGRGPGDFLRLMWLGQCANDSIFVWDYRLRQVTVLDSAGQRARTFSFASKVPGSAPPGVVACSRTGRFAIQPIGTWKSPHVIVTPDSTVIRPRTPVWITDRAGRITADIGEVWARETYTLGRQGALHAAGYRPVGRGTSISMIDDLTYVGTADSSALDVYGPTGRRIGVMPLGIASRPVSRSHVDAAIDAEVESFAGDLRDAARELLLTLPAPKQLPSYTALFADPLGVLWAVASSPGDADTRIIAVDSTGRALADLWLPADVTIFEIGRDYILGRCADANDEPHIGLFRLRR